MELLGKGSIDEFTNEIVRQSRLLDSNVLETCLRRVELIEERLEHRCSKSSNIASRYNDPRNHILQLTLGTHRLWEMVTFFTKAIGQDGWEGCMWSITGIDS
jgi:hypothetical protein